MTERTELWKLVNMGGKKKLSLKQMEQAQQKKDETEKEKKKKEKAVPSKEKRTPTVVPPDARDEKVVSEVKKMHVLTPFAVATRFNIRISAAKDFLDQLQENGSIQLVSGNHNIKIYKAA
jgi:small subunit ribosomal protein S25e